MPFCALSRSALVILALASIQPAAALTITPYYDSSIVGAADQSAVEGAIADAIETIEGLYTNSGTIGIVFSQADGTYLGESETSDAFLSYGTYTADLTAASGRETGNAVLASAVANLASGNDANGAKNVAVTAADLKLALGLHGVSGCFNTSGAFINTCGQTAYGTVTLTDNPNYSLNYGTTAVSGAYSMIDAAEHEIDEILGGGGQGSMLNAVYDGTATYDAAVGVLDLYRYSAPGMFSFTTSSSATAYFSVDGGTTDIVGFNQNYQGDYADFVTNDNVQSAFSPSGIIATYNSSSPEFAMMESIGYNGVPEPASLAVLAFGMAALRAVRRRRIQ